MLIVPLVACLFSAFLADTPVGLVVQSGSISEADENVPIENFGLDTVRNEKTSQEVSHQLAETDARSMRVARSDNLQNILDSYANDGWGELDLVPTKDDIFHKYVSKQKIGLPKQNENVFSILLNSSPSEDISADDDEEQQLNWEGQDNPVIDPEEKTKHKHLVKYGREEYRDHLHAKHLKHGNSGEEHVQMKREDNDEFDGAAGIPCDECQCNKNSSRVCRKVPCPCFGSGGGEVDPGMIGVESKKLVAEIIMGAKPHRKDLGLCRQNLEPCYALEDNETSLHNAIDEVMMCVSEAMRNILKNIPCVKIHPDLRRFLGWLLTGKSESKVCVEGVNKPVSKDGFLFHRHRHKPGVPCNMRMPIWKPVAAQGTDPRKGSKGQYPPRHPQTKGRKEDKKFATYIESQMRPTQKPLGATKTKSPAPRRPPSRKSGSKMSDVENGVSTKNEKGDEDKPKIGNRDQMAAYEEGPARYPMFMSFQQPMCETNEIYL